jgi:putative membrane protein
MKEDTSSDQPYVREHLANERTLLAWIRTCIGIMAFGFVVVKFSLFVTGFPLMTGSPAPPEASAGLSSVIGILLVAFGALLLLLAYLKFKRAEKQINQGAYHSSSGLILGLTVIVFLVSILLLIYLTNLK